MHCFLFKFWLVFSFVAECIDTSGTYLNFLGEFGKMCQINDYLWMTW